MNSKFVIIKIPVAVFLFHYIEYCIIIIIIINEFLASQLRLGNIHLSCDM